MGRTKFFCAYCDAYLTHSNIKGRKQHNQGRKHRENIVHWFRSFVAREYLGSKEFHDWKKVGFALPSPRSALSDSS